MAQNKFYRILSIAVMATVLTALLAVTAFAEITGGFGEILGLEDGKTYTAKPVVINENGDGKDYADVDGDGDVDEADVIDLSTGNNDLAGLYEVTEEGEEPVIVYIYGDIIERAKLGNWTTSSSGDIMPVYEESKKTFKPGTWMAAKGSVWTGADGWAEPAATGTSYLLGSTWVQNANLGFELFALTNSYETAKTKLTAANLENVTNWYNTYYNWDDVVVDVATGEPIEGKPAEGVETTTVRTYGDIKDTGIARADAIRNTTKNNFEGFSFKYAFEPQEIIPVGELEEFPFYVKTVQWYTFPSKAKAQAIFYVMDKNGEVDEYTWTSNYMSITDTSGVIINTVIDAQSILPDEGWVVGVDIKPFAIAEADSVKAVTTGSTNSTIHATQYYYSFYWNKYKTECSVTYPAPEVSIKGTVISGLDPYSGITYYVAPMNINGFDKGENNANVKTVTGKTKMDLSELYESPVGLYGIYYVDSDYSIQSETTVVYVYGSHAERAALFERVSKENGDKTAWNFLEGNIKYKSVAEFVPGFVTGKGAWGHYSSWATEGISTHDYHLKATNTYVKAFVTPTEEISKEQAFAEIQKILKAITLKYAFTSKEIIPVSLVNHYTFKLGNENGPMTYKDQRMKVEAHIMTPDGVIENITYIAPIWQYRTGNYQTVKLDFTDASLWEEKEIPDGYLVGFTIYPYDNFDDIGNFGLSSATNSRFVFYNGEYSIDKPVAETPEIQLDGTVISGLDATKTYAVIPYGINGEEPGTDNVNIKTVTGKSEADLSTRYESPVGLYKVYVLEDDYYADSDGIIIYVRGSYSARKALHELYTSGSNTNILKMKSQATGDLGFVRGAVTRYIKYASSDSSQVYNGTTLYLNVAYPGTTSLVPETSFSYNLISPFASATGDKQAAFEQIQAVAKTEVYRYGLTDEEIVPINEVKKYTFGIATDSNTGGVSDFSYKNGKARFEAYVMDKNGVINKYNYFIDLTIKFEAISKLVVDFTDDKWYAEGSETPSALPKDGYFVGYVVYPYHGFDNPDNLTVGINTSIANYTSDKARTYYFFYYGEDDYVIHMPQLESPKNVTVEGTVVSGLDENTKYILVPYNVNGAVAADKKEISGVESFDIADYFDNPVGIYGLSVAGNGIIVDSDPYVIYLKGNSTTSIVHTHEFTATSGSYKDKTVDVWDTSSTNNFVEAKWTNSSICHLANHSLHPLMLSSGNGGGNGTKYTSTQAIIKALSTEVYRYQLTANEIAPLSSFVSFSYKTYLRQGSYSYKSGTIYSLFTFVVMTEDGKIEKRTVNKAVNGFSTSSVSVTLDDFADKSGYILGIEITPYGAVSEDAVIQPVAGSKTEADPCIYLTKDSYKSTDTYLQGISLILDGAIGANINFTYDADTVESAKLVFDEATGLEPIAATLKDGKGSVIVPFYPKTVNTLAYTAELVVTKKDSTESTLEVNNISVKAYIDAMQAAPETYAKWIPLINALEVYCDYAENYFSNDAALDAVTLTEEELAFVGEKSNRDKNGSLTGVEFYSTSLVLLDTMTIRHYFVADKDFDFSGITVTGGSALAVPEIKPGAANAYVYVDVANIPAHKLDEVQSITLTKGEEALTISFSAMDYVEIIEGDTNAKLVNLAKVIAKYAYAASQIK